MIKTYKVQLTTKAKEGLSNLKERPDALNECKRLLKDLERVGERLGTKLENKHGMDLSTCYKIYFSNREFRIVYRKTETQIEIIEVIAIGERNDLKVYKEVHDWLTKD